MTETRTQPKVGYELCALGQDGALSEPFRSSYPKTPAGFIGDVPGPGLSNPNDPGAVHTPVQ